VDIFLTALDANFQSIQYH